MFVEGLRNYTHFSSLPHRNRYEDDGKINNWNMIYISR